jgi:hypothetical protein
MSKEDEILRQAARKEGERIIGLLHEPDRDKIIAWRAATTITKQVVVMDKIDAEMRNIVFGLLGALFLIMNLIFILSRPDGWPMVCSLEHKEPIMWQIGCDDGTVRCSESNETVYFVANVGDWKCKTNDKRHFVCDDVAKLPQEF